MKTQQTPLNTPQPDTKDVQASLDQNKASTRKLHAEIQEITANRHHPSCRPSDRDLVWFCNQCGDKESAEDLLPAPPAQAPRKPDPASHSPLPWTLVGEQFDFMLLGNTRPSKSGKVTSTGPITVSDEVAFVQAANPADAAFIVRACNHAQRLADALDGLLKAYMDIPDREIGCNPAHRYDKAREALAQWEQDNE